MAPVFEPGGIFLAVRQGVVFDFAVVEGVGEEVGDVAGGESGADVLSVIAVAGGPAGL